MEESESGWIASETAVWTESALAALRSSSRWYCNSLRGISKEKFRNEKRPVGVPTSVSLEEYVAIIITEMEQDPRLKYEESDSDKDFFTLVSPTLTSAALTNHAADDQPQMSSADVNVLYPIRPGETDCVFFLRTGVCSYGTYCRFNHPIQARTPGVRGMAEERSQDNAAGDNYKTDSKKQNKGEAETFDGASNGPQESEVHEKKLQPAASWAEEAVTRWTDCVMKQIRRGHPWQMCQLPIVAKKWHKSGALPKGVTAKQYIKHVTNELKKNPQLNLCVDEKGMECFWFSSPEYGPTCPANHVSLDPARLTSQVTFSPGISSKKNRSKDQAFEPRHLLSLEGSQPSASSLTYAQISGITEQAESLDLIERKINAKGTDVANFAETSEHSATLRQCVTAAELQSDDLSVESDDVQKRENNSTGQQIPPDSQPKGSSHCIDDQPTGVPSARNNGPRKYDPVIRMNASAENQAQNNTQRAPAPGGGSLEEELHRYFFCPTQSPLGMQRGCALADRQHAAYLSEAALLGTLDKGTIGASARPDVNHVMARTVGESGEHEVYLNTGEPFCLAAVGVQGGGKSHTMACVLESCLVPFPEHGVVRLQQPMSALVLHYDHNVTSVCEATGLISPAPQLSRILAGHSRDVRGGDGAGAPQRCLPRENMVVLVSPSYWRQRKAFYGDYCIVKPLLFKWGSLTADHIKKIMRIKDGDTQLYMAAMLDLLRQYQQAAVTPAFPAFVQQVRQHCNLKGQEGPLAQRLRLLESVVAEGVANAALAAESADLWSCVRPGVLVVADLTDPLLASDEANGIFQVLTEQYRAMPSAAGGGGKLLALDEAHKFMSGAATDGLSEAIVNVARLMRHDGMRLAVSTQSPAALAPELLELVTVAVLHRFHSRDWFTYLAKKLPLPAAARQQLMELQPGHALVFASQHRVPAVGHMAASGAGGRGALGGGGMREGEDVPMEEEEGSDGGGGQEHVFAVHVRPRITADRGATRINAAGP